MVIMKTRIWLLILDAARNLHDLADGQTMAEILSLTTPKQETSILCNQGAYKLRTSEHSRSIQTADWSAWQDEDKLPILNSVPVWTCLVNACNTVYSSCNAARLCIHIIDGSTITDQYHYKFFFLSDQVPTWLGIMKDLQRWDLFERGSNHLKYAECVNFWLKYQWSRLHGNISCRDVQCQGVWHQNWYNRSDGFLFCRCEKACSHSSNWLMQDLEQTWNDLLQ